jgi:hypothetical protein
VQLVDVDWSICLSPSRFLDRFGLRCTLDWFASATQTSSLDSLIVEMSDDDDQKNIEDPLLQLLNQQLQGVNTSLVVCKWPVTLTSCFFLTLLCWDMAGDKGGWSQALWVPIVGVVMPLLIWVCDRMLSWSSHFRFFSTTRPSSLPSDVNQDPIHTLELVHSSLHQFPVPQGSDFDL